jgi:NAD(P)-dependent dehydrogenase (short-subunit alcohol dehydrogenase family)
LLLSLQSNSNVAVIGASGGIGRAFVELLAADSNVATIHALSRSQPAWPSAKVQGHYLDLTDERSIEAAAAATGDERLDLVIVASGILHRGKELQPEKTMRGLTAEALEEVFAVNTIGPALVAKHFLPRLRSHHKAVFAALSARVGSISDNRLGGWASYRMSKSALNMLIRTLSIEQSRLRPESILVALHPGTVDTLLSKPFAGRVDPSRLFAPADSARQLLQVINGLQEDDTGGFFAYDGTRIEF